MSCGLIVWIAESNNEIAQLKEGYEAQIKGLQQMMTNALEKQEKRLQGEHEAAMKGMQQMMTNALQKQENRLQREHAAEIEAAQTQVRQQCAAQQEYSLSKTEYLRVKAHGGELKTVRGPCAYALSAGEEVVPGEGWDRSYCKLDDETDIQTALTIDALHALVVRDSSDGSTVLCTTAGLFVPSTSEEVVQVRERISLQNYERIAYIDSTGALCIPKEDENVSQRLFLPPDCEMMTQYWSMQSTQSKEPVSPRTVKEPVSVFDLRPAPMVQSCVNCMNSLMLIVAGRYSKCPLRLRMVSSSFW